jgi:hypothetical protein
MVLPLQKLLHYWNAKGIKVVMHVPDTVSILWSSSQLRVGSWSPSRGEIVTIAFGREATRES